MRKENRDFKICLVGDGGVGKTSLIKRYVKEIYDDHYITTIGTKISKKEILVHHPENELAVNSTLMIWDIAGQNNFSIGLIKAYLQGAQGILAVCDVTREETADNWGEWVEAVYEVNGEVPVVFAANKHDLNDEAEVTNGRLNEIASRYGGVLFKTSAKTGRDVKAAFYNLAKLVNEKEMKLKESNE